MAALRTGRAPARVLVIALAAAVLAAAILLVAATPTTVIEPGHSGWDRHGPALLILAASALVVLPSAARGARPSAVALAVLGLTALLIAVIADLPDLDRPRASSGFGLYAELIGGGLLLAAAGASLGTAALGAGVLGGRGERQTASTRSWRGRSRSR